MPGPFAAAVASGALGAAGSIGAGFLSRSKAKPPSGGDWRKFYEEGPKEVGLSPWDWVGSSGSGASVTAGTEAETKNAEIGSQFRLQKLQTGTQLAQTAISAMAQRHAADQGFNAKIIETAAKAFNSGNPKTAEALLQMLGKGKGGRETFGKETPHRRFTPSGENDIVGISNALNEITPKKFIKMLLANSALNISKNVGNYFK